MGQPQAIGITEAIEETAKHLCNKEIYARQNSLVEELLKLNSHGLALLEKGYILSEFSYDEIINFYEPFQKDVENTVCTSCAVIGDVNESGQCRECFTDHQMPQEIYQWFLVSGWIADKLVDQGEPVLKTQEGSYWGRTCCGQETYLDSCIQKIAKEILCKQK